MLILKVKSWMKIVPFSGSTKKILWQDNKAKYDCAVPGTMLKILMLRSNVFNSIGMLVEHTVDGVNGYRHFAFEIITFFVAEKEFACSFVMFDKIGTRVKSIRFIGDFFYIDLK